MELYGEDCKRYLKVSERLQYRAATLLGHLIREPNEWDHAKKATLTTKLKRVQKKYKRVGRPRFHWLQQTMEFAFNKHRKKRNKKKKVFDMEKKRHNIKSSINR